MPYRDYEYWRNGETRYISLWWRIPLFPIFVIGFWGALLFSRLLPPWWGPGWLGSIWEARLVWWRMVVHGEGQPE